MRTHVAVLVCLVASSIGCDETKYSGAVATAECEAFAANLCARRGPCAVPPDGIALHFGDEATCVERYALACEGWVGAPDANLAPSDAANCAERAGTMSCSEVQRAFSSTWLVLPDCLRVPGVRQAGAACRFDAQCESLYCESSGQGCGTCAEQQGNLRPVVGEACEEGRACENQFLTCQDEVCTAATCENGRCPPPLSAVGRGCGGLEEDAASCDFGGLCLSQNDMGSGVCTAPVRESETCDTWEGPPCLFPARCIEGVCTLPQSVSCGG